MAGTWLMYLLMSVNVGNTVVLLVALVGTLVANRLSLHRISTLNLIVDSNASSTKGSITFTKPPLPPFLGTKALLTIC